ncbi:orotidine 5'-phosphate decarboxylase / HUMPS family protein, partial [Acinetobacter baumannii]
MAEAPATDRLIVALDVPTAAEARAMVARLGGAVSFYKVGHELLFAGGLELARELKAEGKRVFLDMKLLDIGNTM